jgi:hypothetical protein
MDCVNTVRDIYPRLPDSIVIRMQYTALSLTNVISLVANQHDIKINKHEMKQCVLWNISTEHKFQNFFLK